MLVCGLPVTALPVPAAEGTIGRPVGSNANPLATGPALPRGAALTLTSVGSDGKPRSAPSTEATVAANGRYVAFASRAALVPGVGDDESVYLRDLVSDHTTLLSDPKDGDAEAPTISADGRLVGYQADAPSDDVYVVDRRTNTRRRITGGAHDLSYERIPPCRSDVGDGSQRITPCGPKLSADGHVLAYPARQDPIAPTLLTSDRTSSLSGDVLDLTPSEPGRPYGVPDYTDPTVTATVTYRNAGHDPVRFTAPPTLSQAVDNPFRLGATDCTGGLTPGRECTATVHYDSDICSDVAGETGHLFTGRLITHAATPAGQSVLQISAFCFQPQPLGREFAAMAAPAAEAPTACPASPTGLDLVPAPTRTTDNQGTTLVDAGPADIDRPYLMWTVLNAPQGSGSGSAAVTFARADAADCALQLVDPTVMRPAQPLPEATPAPCTEGELLFSQPTSFAPPTPDALPSSCTAYVLVSPGSVTPDNALLGTVYYPFFNSGYSALQPDTYFAVRGVSDIVATRQDPSGTGNFATSPTTVVSVDTHGARLPGASQPTLSATGRYVAFAAPVPVGQPGQQLALGASQVWLRDTESRAKPTQLVSCLPGGRAGSCIRPVNADSPSLSGDGNRLAFATTGHTGQVYVRALRTATTTLVTSGRPSYAPMLAPDGSAVVFVSQAAGLTRPPVPEGTASVYLRRLLPRAGSVALLSTNSTQLSSAAVAGVPSVDAHARLITFPTTARLLANAPPEMANVYTVEEFPRLGSSPGLANFGTTLLGSGTRQITLTITNSGPGPGTVSALTVDAPFRVGRNDCVGQVLYPSASCRVTLAFTPTAPGPADGTVAVSTTDSGETPLASTVDATASVPLPQLVPSPAVASGGQVTHVRGVGLPPGQAITLRWNHGLGTGMAVSSSTGVITVDLVIFPRDVAGPRTIVASSAEFPSLAAASLLVQPASQEPPFPVTP